MSAEARERQLGWLVLSGEGEAAANMALDEALLEAAAAERRPVLRFYGWREPAASFGYFQAYAQAAAWTTLRPLVRRPTGGGLVLHDADWTYSLVLPAGHPWHELKAKESYRRLHEWVRSALARLGWSAELAAGPIAAGSGRCFVGASMDDVMWEGRKMAGAAQRRTRQGLLIQGSVLPPPGLRRSAWESAFAEASESEAGVVWERMEPGAALRARAQELVSKKYGARSFLEKR